MNLPNAAPELLPCPFCGCTPDYCDIIDGVRYPFCCTPTCPMYLENPDEFAWNTRATPPAPTESALGEALVEVLDCFNAAIAEGLYERLVEIQPETGNIRDLIERRLLHAMYTANAALALPKPPTQEM
jgi:hypothetical protein